MPKRNLFPNKRGVVKSAVVLELILHSRAQGQTNLQEQVRTAEGWALARAQGCASQSNHMVLVGLRLISKPAVKITKEMVPRDGIEPSTRGFSVDSATDSLFKSVS